MPPTDAAAEVVADTYLQAVNAGDVTTQQRLATREYAEHLSELSDRDDLRRPAVERVGPVTDASTSGTSVADSYPQSARVSYRYNGGTGGPLPWDVILVRRGDSEPWRVGDEGVG